MIKDETIAKKISELMIVHSAELDASLVEVRDHASAEEFAAYRSAVGRLMGHMLLDIMNPLYAMHPGLTPAELR